VVASASAGTTVREPLILVVDDEAAVRDSLGRLLRSEGFAVTTAPPGPAAVAAVAERRPAAILLDLAAPDRDAPSLVGRLRASGVDAPLCVLSPRDAVPDRVAGLLAGADDYLVKPFALAELSARLRALVRRGGGAVPAPLSVGDVMVDARRFVAMRGGRDLGLTRREFDLLEAFARHPGQVLGREQLLDIVWGCTATLQTNVVDVFVGYLRRKMEAAGEPRVLMTVRGVGWVLRVEPQERVQSA
jgi:DNA-binding response OmpR family regulator